MIPLSIVIGNVRLRDSEPSSVVLRLLTPVQSIQNKIKQKTKLQTLSKNKFKTFTRTILKQQRTLNLKQNLNLKQTLKQTIKTSNIVD